MWIQQIFSGVPQLRDLSRWHFHGQIKGQDRPILGYSIFSQGRSTLPGVCQLLSSIYQRLLQDHNTVNNPDLQRQALLVESNGPGCFWYSQDGIHLYTHPDTSQPCQAIHCGNGRFRFCLGNYSISIWNRWVVASNCFLFRKLTNAEINYQVYDKELLAIITAFEQWKPYLARAQHRVQVLTNHKNLLYFTTTRTSNRRQARWSIFLTDFDFEIQYQPGTQQGKADTLSRRSEYELRAGDEAYSQQNQTLLNPKQFRVAATISTLADSYLVRDIKMETEEDTWATNIKKEL